MPSESDGLLASTELPVRQFDALYHVGWMDAARKGEMSWEGMGLSISVHPAAWTKIGRGHVSGALWELTKADNGFLDVRSLTAEEKAGLVDWGVKEGLLQEVIHGSPWGTDKLFQKVGMLPNHAVAFSFALTVFVDEATTLDGVWWEDRLDFRVGSAPRGTIVPARLSEWSVVPCDRAPDAALLTRRPHLRVPPVRSDRVVRTDTFGPEADASHSLPTRPRL